MAGLRTEPPSRLAESLPNVSVRRPWTAKEQSLLGTAPDQEIAALLHRSVPSIQTRRRKLKIPVFSQRPWNARQEGLLGTLPDIQIAHELGRNQYEVRRRREKLAVSPYTRSFRRWTKKEEKLLGKNTDF